MCRIFDYIRFAWDTSSMPLVSPIANRNNRLLGENPNGYAWKMSYTPLSFQTPPLIRPTLVIGSRTTYGGCSLGICCRQLWHRWGIHCWRTSLVICCRLLWHGWGIHCWRTVNRYWTSCATSISGCSRCS